MLANSSHQVVRLRITPTFPSNYEDINGDLDVIGVKTNENAFEIVMFESKGRAQAEAKIFSKSLIK